VLEGIDRKGSYYAKNSELREPLFSSGRNNFSCFIDGVIALD